MARPAHEVDKPTYEIVGAVERYDARDTPTARFLLEPGTPEYEEYYSSHPEKKDWDDENRRIMAVARKRGKELNPVNQQLRPAVFYGRSVLSQKSVIEGGTTSRVEGDTQTVVARGGKVQRIDVDPIEITRKIKDFGHYLGAAKVRVTKLNQDWVYTHSAAMGGPEVYGKKVELNYDNVICLAFRNNVDMLKDGIGVANNIEAGWRYAQLSLACVVIAHFIQSLGWRARALPPEGAPFFAVPTAVDAGIGEQGRTCHLVTKEFGNAVRLGGVATDMPLVIDKPVDFGLQDFCEKCHICADYCRAGCIRQKPREVVRGVRRWVVEGDKCRRYRSTIGHNCSICLVVCPWGHPNNLFHDTVREVAQNFPWMRKFLIRCEKTFYNKGKGGQYKPVQEPDWITSKGTRDIQNS